MVKLKNIVVPIILYAGFLLISFILLKSLPIGVMEFLENSKLALALLIIIGLGVPLYVTLDTWIDWIIYFKQQMKKRKCRDNWFLAIVMVIVFFFILPFSVKYGWFDFLEDEKFDPEKDVCLRDTFDTGITINKQYAECLEWRPKNECEKGNKDYWYVNEAKSDGKYLYYTGEKICALKMKVPNSAKIGSMSVK